MSGRRVEVRLGDVLRRSTETAVAAPGAFFKEITVRLWGKGVVSREPSPGGLSPGTRRFVARKNQFILSRIDARNGAVGIVPNELDGALVTNDFPLYTIDASVEPAYLAWLSKSSWFVEQCSSASEGTTNRIRLKEIKFLNTIISVPTIEEQRATVGVLASIAAHSDSILQEWTTSEADLDRLLMAAYGQLASTAPRRTLAEAAPLRRRPTEIDISISYPQLSVRSFGRGTFHKPAVCGADITWQKLFRVEAKDIVISNIKSWEGAIAVATSADNGRYGSHRLLSFVADPRVALPRFVCFHLLTPEGLYDVGQASPGSADRNRTLNTKAFAAISMPVPTLQQQLWFEKLWLIAEEVRQLRRSGQAEIAALRLSALERAFAYRSSRSSR